MSVATLTVYTLARTGKDLTVGAAALVAATATDGDKWQNTGVEFLAVKNGGMSDCVVTLHVQATVDGQAVTNPTVTALAGSTILIGPFPTPIYNDPSGYALVTFDQVTSVKVGAFKVQ